MSHIRLPALAARAFAAALVLLSFAPPVAAQSEESAIRRAFEDFRQMGKPGMSGAPAAMAPDMAAFYGRAARKAYGIEALGAASGPYPEAYAVYMLRGAAICPYLGAQKDSVLRVLQGGDGVGALDLLRRNDLALPWSRGEETLGAVQVSGDTATAEYRWAGTRPLGRGTPLSFSDSIEFRRTSGRWALAFDAYIAMLDRHWSMLASSVVPRIDPATDAATDKTSGALDVATARAFAYMDSPACPDSRAHLERLKDAKRGETLENFRVRLGKVLETPAQDWPEPKVLAWWTPR
ncbi:MAG: hypothetical protein ACYC1L_15140 [Alphaproteobacteria bacterium]